MKTSRVLNNTRRLQLICVALDFDILLRSMNALKFSFHSINKFYNDFLKEQEANEELEEISNQEVNQTLNKVY